MPAPRRFKQSEIDLIRQKISALPAGTPPEPEFSKEEALASLQSEIRRRHLEDHVSIADIVEMLNGSGFNTSVGKISRIISGKGKRQKAVPPIKKNGTKAKATTASPETDPKTVSDGSFALTPDDPNV